MNTEEQRLRDLEFQQIKTAARLDGHEDTCAVRYKAIEQGQAETISKIEQVHDHVKRLHEKTDQRLEAMEKIRWVMSGKLVSWLAGLLVFAVGGVIWLLNNPKPWE